MKLSFIRHGQTDWNVSEKIQGSTDCELNNVGIAQAEELGRKILEQNDRFSKIYTSPQKRAVKTAEILSKAVNLEYIVVEGLKEINLGVWEGLSWAEVQEKYPVEFEHWCKHRRYTKAPKGEAYQDMLERVLVALQRIIEEKCEHVAIVTHSAVIMCLQCYITNTPFEKMMNFKTGNVSIVEMDSELIYSNTSAKTLLQSQS